MNKTYGLAMAVLAAIVVVPVVGAAGEKAEVAADHPDWTPVRIMWDCDDLDAVRFKVYTKKPGGEWTFRRDVVWWECINEFECGHQFNYNEKIPPLWLFTVQIGVSSLDEAGNESTIQEAAWETVDRGVIPLEDNNGEENASEGSESRGGERVHDLRSR